MDRLICKRLSLQVCGGQTNHTVFPSRSWEQNWSEPEIVTHFTSCGRSHMQRDCLSCCRVKCVHVLCETSGNQLVPGFDCAPVRCSLCAVKIWLEAFSLHTVRGFWQSCTVCSCRFNSSPFSPPLSSSSPSLFCSWGSDFSLPCHWYSLAKPFKALNCFPWDTVSF